MFTVLQTFHQSLWLSVLCAAVAAALAGVALYLRIRSITRAARACAEERADERIRKARELHDTLLQSIQGLVLSFHVVAQRMPDSDPSKPLLERALAAADRVGLEGRRGAASLLTKSS